MLCWTYHILFIERDMEKLCLFKIRDDYLRVCLSVSFYCSSLEKAHNPNISHSSVVLCMHIGLCVCVCVCMICTMCVMLRLRQSPLCLSLHVFAKLAWLAALQDSPVSSQLSLGEPGLQITTNPSLLWVLRI